jgi:hypothetical protein
MDAAILRANSDKIHTTELGAVRIRKNLNLAADDVVGWCKAIIADAGSSIVRTGKNWYVESGDIRLTVNAYSYTIISAHKITAIRGTGVINRQ